MLTKTSLNFYLFFLYIRQPVEFFNVIYIYILLFSRPGCCQPPTQLCVSRWTATCIRTPMHSFVTTTTSTGHSSIVFGLARDKCWNTEATKTYAWRQLQWKGRWKGPTHSLGFKSLDQMAKKTLHLKTFLAVGYSKLSWIHRRDAQMNSGQYLVSEFSLLVYDLYKAVVIFDA